MGPADWRLARWRDAVADSATVAAAVIVAAALSRVLLVSFVVLFAAGALIGLRHRSAGRWTAIGSIVGALLVYGWVLVNEPTDNIDGLRNGISSAVLLGLIVAGALVVPGYLFARAYRRSGGLPSRSDDTTDPRSGPSAPPEPSVRSSIVIGCLILAADTLVLLRFLTTAPGP